MFECVCVFVCYVLSFASRASNSCEPPLLSLSRFFFFRFYSFSHRLRFVEFSLLPPDQQQPRRIFSLAATVDSSAWCTIIARPPPCSSVRLVCVCVRGAIVKHVFYFVRVYVLYSYICRYIWTCALCVCMYLNAGSGAKRVQTIKFPQAVNTCRFVHVCVRVSKCTYVHKVTKLSVVVWKIAADAGF